MRIRDGTLRVSVPASSAPPLTIAHRDDQLELAGGESYEAPVLRVG